MRPRTTLLLAAFACCLVTMPCPGQAPRDPVEADQEALEIFSSVMSPFCPGRLLANCPSAQASELQTEIRQKLRGGASKAQVLAELYQTYGDDVRGVPRAEGVALFAWLVPGVFLLLGIAVTVAWIRWRPATTVSSSNLQAGTLTQDEQMKLNAELSKFSSLT